MPLIQLNDTHSYLESHQELFWEGDQAQYKRAGGFARIAEIINGIRSKDKALNAIDNLKRYLQKKKTINAKLQNSIIPV